MKKKLLISTGILLLFITLIGFWGYNNYLKPDPNIQQQLSNQFGTDFFNSFEDKIAKESGPVNTQKFGVDLTQKTDTPKIVSAMERARLPQNTTLTALAETASTPAKQANDANPLTQEDINNKYRARFNYLQDMAFSRLDTLSSAARQEFLQNKKAGTLNRSALVRKYIQAGTMLETSMDSEFNHTLSEMQAELAAHNLPTDSVEVYKSEYAKAKSAKRAQLLAKIRKG